MPTFAVGTYPWTIGAIIALVVLLLAILGLVGVLPLSQTVVFGLFAGLAIARLT
jgi:hypothetical protein